jgi:hypothetical protein
MVPWAAVANHRWSLSYPPRSGRPCNAGRGRPRCRQGGCAGDACSCCWLTATRKPRWPRWSAAHAPSSVRGRDGVSPSAARGWSTLLAAAPRAVVPPEVAIPLVRLAGERPALLGRSLAPWDGRAVARQLTAEAIVEAIAASTVRRRRAAHPLKPWRHHLWRYPTHPREAGLYATVSARLDRYTRPLHADEIGLWREEKPARQPRPRPSPPLPAPPYHRPNRCEQADKRARALNLFAACATRSGQVYGPCEDRKRQADCIAVLEPLDQEIPEPIRTIHRVCDHGRTHHGQEVARGSAHHPRFVVHFTPGHCSWMTPVDQWCSLLQRKRLRMGDLPTNDQLRAKLEPCIGEWNQQAHPVNWSVPSVAKVMAEAPALAA